MILSVPDSVALTLWKEIRHKAQSSKAKHNMVVVDWGPMAGRLL